ncbi:MAG TPA: alpha-amylase, partial [Porphyromonadaceae bacterium]|nr:alpha-amylase [Porphyromonadaceae bacterium]
DYLYDKVNLYDTLVGIERHGYSAARLTGCWQTVAGIGDRMLNFLENHDEVRYGSREFACDPLRVTPSLVTSALMSRCPFMIYYGQELGESAEDNEGFAGDNFRSTIFDYWSYDTMRRWYNHGKCDGAGLNAQQQWLRSRYARVLNICNSEKCVAQGKFFDLMYVNLQNPGLNPHDTFAFLRYTGNEALLVVANFSNEEKKAEVVVPSLAFEMARLPEGRIRVQELLTDTASEISLSPDCPAAVRVGSRDAAILKFSCRQA